MRRFKKENDVSFREQSEGRSYKIQAEQSVWKLEREWNTSFFLRASIRLQNL